jgi:hypothetical protein
MASSLPSCQPLHPAWRNTVEANYGDGLIAVYYSQTRKAWKARKPESHWAVVISFTHLTDTEYSVLITFSPICHRSILPLHEACFVAFCCSVALRLQFCCPHLCWLSTLSFPFWSLPSQITTKDILRILRTCTHLTPPHAVVLPLHISHSPVPSRPQNPSSSSLQFSLLPTPYSRTSSPTWFPTSPLSPLRRQAFGQSGCLPLVASLHSLFTPSPTRQLIIHSAPSSR